VFHKVLVAVDGSAGAQRALQAALHTLGAGGWLTSAWFLAAVAGIWIYRADAASRKEPLQPRTFALMLVESACIPIPSEATMLFAGFAVAGLRTTLEQQIIACLIGTGTVVLVAFAARRMAGKAQFVGVDIQDTDSAARA